MELFEIRVSKSRRPAALISRWRAALRWALLTCGAAMVFGGFAVPASAVLYNLPIASFETLADPTNDAQAQGLFGWKRSQNLLFVEIGENTPDIGRQYPFGNPKARSKVELSLDSTPPFDATVASIVINGSWRTNIPFESPPNDSPNIRDRITFSGGSIGFDEIVNGSSSFRECAENGDGSGCGFSLTLTNIGGLVDRSRNRIVLQTDYADGDTQNSLSDSIGENVFTIVSFQLDIPFVPPTIRDVHLCYNKSALDGNGLLVGPQDFAAIAPGKDPLRLGQTATSVNVSGYSRGINGIFIDIDNLPSDGAAINADDFVLSSGNNNFTNTWTATSPTGVGVLAGQGAQGADRVYLTLPETRNAWLRVTMRANPDTGLQQDEHYFFGAAPGETGMGFLPGVVGVDAADLQSIAANLTPIAQAGTVAITNPNDVNRDRTINAFDLQVLAQNLNTRALSYITPQLSASAATQGVPEPASVMMAVVVGVFGWLVCRGRKASRGEAFSDASPFRATIRSSVRGNCVGRRKVTDGPAVVHARSAGLASA